MLKFLKALTTKNARTENGMATHSTSGKATLDLFAKAGAMRAAEPDEIIRVFASAYGEDRLTALRLLFWARDIRGGAGERKFFRTGLRHLAFVDPDVVKANIDLIPEYGRWDDLFSLFDTALRNDALKVIAEGLQADNGLCAKWMPRPSGSDVNKKRANIIRKFLGVTPADYRKLLVERTSVVESDMCARTWTNIRYDHVPSLALSRYGKAFAKRDSDRFQEFKDALKSGTATTNAGAIYPYDVVKSLMYNPENLEIAQDQWKRIPMLFDPREERILAVCDTSGSMTMRALGTGLVPLHVCIALGMFVAERNIGPFKDHFLTFSTQPRLQKLSGNLLNRIAQVNTGEIANTDLHAMFNLILHQAVRHKVSENEMPTKILILSDMEFDACVEHNDSAIEMIRRKYRDAGYTLPQVVFWNLQSRGSNIPIREHETGTALVSGFSPSILTAVLGDIDPISVMLRVVNSERYQRVNLPGVN